LSTYALVNIVTFVYQLVIISVNSFNQTGWYSQIRVLHVPN